MNKTLKITLLSDLCAATGKYYAAMIDTDTALDEYGIPFIPSRRLKGCLRETAEYFLEKETIERIFGVSGNDAPGSLSLGNALIADYKRHVDAIEKSKCNVAKISDLFCTVRGQTAIENGHADSGSLRYTRVVNRYNPLSEGEPLSFFADISFDDADEIIIRKAVAGLKNIGYKRNRGLGLVKCELIESTRDAKMVLSPASSDYGTLRLTVELLGDLMLPDTDTNHSQDYISGAMVLGAMASRYIKRYGDQDFNDIFYSDVRFCNLYPAIASEKGYDYTVPIPRFFAKIKSATSPEDKGIKNLLAKAENDTRTYKPIKSGYVTENLMLVKPKEKIVYHNANTGTEEQDLFMQFCLSSGQYFSGVICGSVNKLNKLAALLSEGETINFGRSKTAQYSACRVARWNWENTSTSNVMLYKGVPAAYVLQSDMVLTDENGIYTCNASDIYNVLGINADTIDARCSGLSTKIISGYNSKWNLKKPQFPVITAGSSIVFIPEKDLELPEYTYIGEQQNEGFGCVRLIADASQIEVGVVVDTKASVCEYDEIVNKLEENAIMDSILALAVENALKTRKSGKTKLDSSQVGRIMLMLKESWSFTSGYDDFLARIESIKTKSTKDNTKALFDEYAIQRVFTCSNINIPMEWKYIRKYIATVLTVIKYQLRMGGKDND